MRWIGRRETCREVLDWPAPSHVAAYDACEAVYCSHKWLAVRFEKKELKNSLNIGLIDAKFAKKRALGWILQIVRFQNVHLEVTFI